MGHTPWSHLGQDGQVEVSPRRDVGQQGGGGGGEGALAVQLGRQVVPVLQADLEDLRLLHLRHQQHVVQGLRREEWQVMVIVSELVLNLKTEPAVKTSNEDVINQSKSLNKQSDE